jgi:hypothetical protein
MTILQYDIEDYNRIASHGKAFKFQKEFYAMIESIDEKITPISTDKNIQDTSNRKTDKKSKPTEESTWSSLKPKYKSTITATEGTDKWIQDIRVCINKMSLKNYDNQLTAILELLEKCLSIQKEDEKNANFKKIADFIFSVASSNIFFASIYASLFKVLMGKYAIFTELLRDYLNSYVNGVTKIKYVDPDVNYDDYCIYNKENDMRKANAVFIIHLVKQNALPVLKVLNIITSFQDLTTQYIEEENRVHEVEEIAEILFLFLKGGKEIFQECKAEFIWKFLIIPNIDRILKYKKGDKPSLSSRAIFKYMDISSGVNAQPTPI